MIVWVGSGSRNLTHISSNYPWKRPVSAVAPHVGTPDSSHTTHLRFRASHLHNHGTSGHAALTSAANSTGRSAQAANP